LVKVALKRGGEKGGGLVGEEVCLLLDFVSLVRVWVVLESACVSDCTGLGLFTVGTVG
jgi:hypothetical protein